MRINNNLMAMNTHRQLGLGNTAGAKSMEKLSSGYRINRAGDDAAGLSISEKMRAQIRGLSQSSRNAQDGISLIQTAEGALNETHAILQRMRELSDQSANGTNTAEERSSMQNEVNQLKEEIDRIGNTTEFNTMKLLNGSLKSAGGAVASQDTTTGSVVAKLTQAKVQGSAAMHEASSKPGDANFIDEKVVIDGTEITIKWGNLSSEEKNLLKGITDDSSSRNAAKDLIINKINEAIDESGANIDHVSGYVDANSKLVIESGSKGTSSNFEFQTDAAVLSRMLTDGAGTAANVDVTAGTTNYNGSTVAANSEFNFEIDGIRMQATTGAAAIDTTTTMASAANIIATQINAVIDSYNTLQGKAAGDEGFIEDVKVNVLDDGRFQVVSESGPISFSDLDGSTVVQDLGLSQAQTESAGNGGMTLQIGANRGQTMTFGINDMRSNAIGLSKVNISTQSGASAALDTLDKAIKSVSEERSKLGAVQNRLEHSIKNLDTSAENLQASESRIRDVDMAKEMMEFTKNNILQQAAQAMLAQANQAPQGVLQLLR